MLKRCAYIAVFLYSGSFLAFAQGEASAVEFTANNGQWHSNVLYRAEVSNGLLYMESDAFTWLFYSGSPLDHHGTDGAHEHHEEFKAHAYQMRFEGASGTVVNGQNKQQHFRNFFLGKDQSKWASKVPVYSGMYYDELYSGIDLKIHGYGAGLKYDLIVEAGAEAEQIQMVYDGADELWMEDGHLHVRTSVNEVIENAPYAYQNRGSARVEVPCEFELMNNRVVFRFPDGYDTSKELVIDPILTFASLSGSAANNFGFTATYDDDGNLYGGGIVFTPGAYPTTMGAYQTAHAGGTIDMGITKFSSDGSTLIYSTLIGGSLNESPHSMVVNSNDELVILGTTGSADFPTSISAYDGTFNGGTLLTYTIGYGYNHVNGTDIVISKLSADGAQLLGSTYLGGTSNDGANNSSSLSYNYGDAFRGEVIVDATDDILIATTTNSIDIPTTAGAPQSLFGGGLQDAYIAKLSTDLDNLLFATFHGGADHDSGYGIQLSSSEQIYVTGGTASPDLPNGISPPFDGTYNGSVDPYIARYSSNGNTLLGCTFLGTSSYDQSYFVQLDPDDKVYVVGQTEGPYPVSANVWNNPGSGQFIHKLSNDLSTSEWSTVIGTGNGTVDISPSAFLVSNCGQIYFSGWGGSVNNLAQPSNSTTSGMPVTLDAAQNTTDGSDFYLLVLEPDADTIAYATYFGGDISSEHVDGGTSRFDKKGNVYQAVCAGCGGNNDFPTTPGAYSNTNGASCNLGVFKFNLATITAEIDISGPEYVCHPDSAEFINLSLGGTDFIWLFGDGETSTVFEPNHYYQDTGTYVVQFILSDSTSCIFADTAEITITVYDPLDAVIQPVDTICEGSSIQLFASGGYDFEWFPPVGLSQTDIATPIATPPSDGFIYSVIVTDSCAVDTVSVTLNFFQESYGIDPAPVICANDTIQLNAFGGGTYSWWADPDLIDNASATPSVFPSDTTMFYVDITTQGGCVYTDSILVEVDPTLPVPTLNDAAICLGENVQLIAGGGTTYEWLPAPGIINLLIQDPFVDPIVPTTYYVNVSNACGTVLDSAFVDVIEITASAWPDTTICEGGSVQLFASGGTDFLWSPASLSDVAVPDPIASPPTSTIYMVQVSDVNGCLDTAYVSVDLFPNPYVDAGDDITLDFGESAVLDATGNGSFLWIPDEFLNCSDCEDPVVFPQTSMTYTVELTDENGCKSLDVVNIYVLGTLYVPNTFSPDGDGINDVFYAQGLEIKDFKMMIFNRWGELIFETDDLFNGWDGTYNSTDSPIDTYVWKIDLVENSGEKRNAIGHVNLIR